MNFGVETIGKSDLQRIDKGVNYAYLDKYKILHVVDSETIDTVKGNNPNIKVLQKKIDCFGGYPVVGHKSIVAGIDEAGKIVSGGYPEIEDLIGELLEL
jgi:hypothetical protein